MRSRRRRRRGPRHVAVDWRGLADGRVHVLRRGFDFAHPTNAMADLAKVAAGRLGRSAVVMTDNLGSYELMWVQFAELETVADEPCPGCGSALEPRNRVLARCSGCGKLVVVRSRKQGATPEAIALLDKALGRGAGGEPPSPALPTAASRPKRERPRRRKRAAKGGRAARAERQPSAERLERLDQKSLRGELASRYGRRLEDFQELELFYDEAESEARVDRFYGHGIDPSGNVSILRVDFALDDAGHRVHDVRNEGQDLYKLLVMPLSTFERLGDARFGTDDDDDDED